MSLFGGSPDASVPGGSGLLHFADAANPPADCCAATDGHSFTSPYSNGDSRPNGKAYSATDSRPNGDILSLANGGSDSHSRADIDA